MAHYFVKLDETYFTVDSGKLVLKNVLDHNTGGYIFNPTTIGSYGFDPSSFMSALSKAQLDSLFQILNPPDLNALNLSDFTLTNWTANGWGNTLAQVAGRYETFITNHFSTLIPSNSANNPGFLDTTTYAVYGAIGANTYFVPVMAFSNRGYSPLTLMSGREPFHSTTNLTLAVSTNVDDGNFKTDTFPFSWFFFGTDYASSVYVGSNTYITFGFGSSAYGSPTPLSASNPGRGILVGAADNSYQRVWHGVRKLGIGANENSTYIVRYEGNGSTTGVVGRPGIAIQWTFFNEQKLNISINTHNQTGGQVGVSNGTSYAHTVSGGGSWTLSQNTSYALSSDSQGNNWVVYPGKFWAYPY